MPPVNLNLPFPSREAADLLADAKHAHQVRYGGEPYTEHTRRVAQRAEELLGAYYKMFGGGMMIPSDQLVVDTTYCAARLHDVMEDCGVTFEDVAHCTNLRTAEMVAALSHDQRLPFPQRIREYCSRLYDASFETQVVKIADLEDNLKGAVVIFKQDGNQAREFFQHWLESECHQVLSVLRKFERFTADIEEFQQVWEYNSAAIVGMVKRCHTLKRNAALTARIAARQQKEAKNASA